MRNLVPMSTAVKRPRRFSFYLIGFKWKHGQGCMKLLVNVTIFSFFFKIMSFSLKTDQNSLGLSKIVLANGADNPAVHSF